MQRMRTRGHNPRERQHHPVPDTRHPRLRRMRPPLENTRRRERHRALPRVQPRPPHPSRVRGNHRCSHRQHPAARRRRLLRLRPPMEHPRTRGRHGPLPRVPPCPTRPHRSTGPHHTRRLAHPPCTGTAPDGPRDGKAGHPAPRGPRIPRRPARPLPARRLHPGWGGHRLSALWPRVDHHGRARQLRALPRVPPNATHPHRPRTAPPQGQPDTRTGPGTRAGRYASPGRPPAPRPTGARTPHSGPDRHALPPAPGGQPQGPCGDAGALARRPPVPVG